MTNKTINNNDAMCVGRSDIGKRLLENREVVLSLYPPFPTKRMNIEITSICNHRCVFCGYKKMTRPRKNMDWEFYVRILKEAYDLGVRETGLYSCGEPFVCKNLNEHVKMAKHIGYTYVYITTNLALPTHEEIALVLDSGLDSMRISINGGSRETYKTIHGRDDYGKAIDNLKFCKQYRDRSNSKCKLYISYIITKDNDHEIEIVRETLSKFAESVDFAFVRNIGGIMHEVKGMQSDLCLNQEKMYNVAPSDFCSRPFNGINITSEGLLSVCTADFQNRFIVGDLNKEKLYDAWYGDKMVEFRRKFLENDLSGTLCQTCIEDASAEANIIESI